MTTLLFYYELQSLSGIVAALLSWICECCARGRMVSFHSSTSKTVYLPVTLKNVTSPLHFSKHYSVSSGWCFSVNSVEASSISATSPAVWPVISPPCCCHLGQFLFTILINGYMHLLLQLLAFSQLVQFPLSQGLGTWLCRSHGRFLC